MNPLPTLRQSGQYVWMDYLRRSLIVNGRLRRLIDEDGLGGVTSTPTIVARAIAESTDYDAGLRRALDVNRDVSDRAVFGLTGTVGDNRCITSAFCHFDRVEGFSQRTDLVHFDKD